MTTGRRKKRRVLVGGDSTIGGTEGPIQRGDPPLREVCCIPGAQVKEVTRRIPSLVQPSDYYPLLVLHLGGEEETTYSPRAIKRDFKELGWMIMESSSQVIFSYILPSTDSDRNSRIVSINTWLRGWCHHKNFEFFGYRKPYMAPGLLASDRIHLS